MKNTTLLRYLFCLVFIFQLSFGHSQTKEDTQLVIQDILKEWASSYITKEGLFVISYKFEFIDNYFIISSQGYHYSKDNKRLENPLCITIIDIKSIKSVKYGSPVIWGEKGITLKCIDGYPIQECKVGITPSYLIKKYKDYSKEELKLNLMSDWVTISCYQDDEKMKRLTKAFSHLVKLYGGQTIEDLFN